MKAIATFLILLAAIATGSAKLVVKVDEPKRTGQKTVIKLTMKNTFKEKIESARAQLFLLNGENQTGTPETRWVIGGTKIAHHSPPVQRPPIISWLRPIKKLR